MTSVKRMRLLPEYIELIRTGEKVTTIRSGKRRVPTPYVLFQSNSSSIKVKVLSVLYKSYDDLTEIDAQRDGFTKLEELQTALKAFYPKIVSESMVTIVEFTLEY